VGSKEIDVKTHMVIRLEYDPIERQFSEMFISERIRSIFLDFVLSKEIKVLKNLVYNTQSRRSVQGSVFERYVERVLMGVFIGEIKSLKGVVMDSDLVISNCHREYFCYRTFDKIQVWFKNTGNNSSMLDESIIHKINEGTSVLFIQRGEYCATVDFVVVRKIDNKIEIVFIQSTVGVKHTLSSAAFFAMIMFVKSIQLFFFPKNVLVKFFFVVEKDSYDNFHLSGEEYLTYLFDAIEIGVVKIKEFENPTTANPITANLTTANPTTANPTTANPTTANLTTANLTTANLTTANLTTANLITANPIAANPTTANLTTANPTTANLTKVSKGFSPITNSTEVSNNLNSPEVYGGSFYLIFYKFSLINTNFLFKWNDVVLELTHDKITVKDFLQKEKEEEKEEEEKEEEEKEEKEKEEEEKKRKEKEKKEKKGRKKGKKKENDGEKQEMIQIYEKLYSVCMHEKKEKKTKEENKNKGVNADDCVIQKKMPKFTGVHCQNYYDIHFSHLFSVKDIYRTVACMRLFASISTRPEQNGSTLTQLGFYNAGFQKVEDFINQLIPYVNPNLIRFCGVRH
jgi:hypothetical protein